MVWRKREKILIIYTSSIYLLHFTVIVLFWLGENLLFSDHFLDLALCPFQGKRVLIYTEYMRLIITTKCYTSYWESPGTDLSGFWYSIASFKGLHWGLNVCWIPPHNKIIQLEIGVIFSHDRGGCFSSEPGPSYWMEISRSSPWNVCRLTRRQPLEGAGHDHCPLCFALASCQLFRKSKCTSYRNFKNFSSIY